VLLRQEERGNPAKREDIRPSNAAQECHQRTISHNAAWRKGPQNMESRRRQVRRIRFHVAVGTRVASRPLRRSGRAPLCIRLLPRVPDGETLVGPGMKNSRLWEPIGSQLLHSSPGETAFLAASAECPTPAFDDLGTKGSQRSPIGRHCVVVEEAGDDLLQPFTLFGYRLMHPPS
jgi:hypothetical protein